MPEILAPRASIIFLERLKINSYQITGKETGRTIEHIETAED
jgi:hypothetical protein